jgi:hypothetical protein
VYTKAILPNDAETLDGVLSKVEEGFNAISQCGVKAIVRFYYLEKDCEGGCIDPPLTRILHHIAELKPKLAQHQDVIMAVQAGFIGAWGEWHGSNLSNTIDQGVVLHALLDAVPATRMVQVRTPRQRHAIFSGTPTVDAQNAIGASGGPEPFSGGPEARTGHHNDCFLSSPTDRGTYSEDPGRRAIELQYVSQNTRYTPMGGETCDFHRDYHPTDHELFNRANAELAGLHWTYLHGGYSEKVNTRLGAHYPDHDDPNSGYQVESEAHGEPWRTIVQRLGYRLTIPSASFTPVVQNGGVFSFRTSFRNLGYAAMFNRRPVYLVLHSDTQTIRFLLRGTDPRRWEPGSLTTYTINVHRPLPAGRYSVSLWLPDASVSLRNRPAYAVRFAHSGEWDSGRGYNLIARDAVLVQ